MKIDLEKPYSDIYKQGYLVINPEGRRTVILYNSHRDRSSVSYARYMMSVKLGRFLNKDEHVDHIDEDKTNDSIENLQILSPSDNHSKTHKKGRSYKKFICPICEKEFYLEARQAHKGPNPCCSKSCGYKKASITRTLRS